MSDKRNLTLAPTILTRRKRCRGACRAEVAFAVFAFITGTVAGGLVWTLQHFDARFKSINARLGQVESTQRILTTIAEEVQRLQSTLELLRDEVEP